MTTQLPSGALFPFFGGRVPLYSQPTQKVDALFSRGHSTSETKFDHEGYGNSLPAQG